MAHIMPPWYADPRYGEYELPVSGEVPTFAVWMKLPLREDRFVQAIAIRSSLQHAVYHSSLALASLPPGTKIGHAPVFAGGPALDGGRVELRAQAGIWYTRRDPHLEVQTWTVNEGVSIGGTPAPTDARDVRIMPDIPPGIPNLPIVGTLKFQDDVTL